jgi:hypothetical protein
MKITNANISWHEPLRLCVAACDATEVDDVLLAIARPLPDEDAEQTARPRLAMAAACLTDEPWCGEAVVQEIIDRMVAAVSSDDAEPAISWTNLHGAVRDLACTGWGDGLADALLKAFMTQPSLRASFGALLGTLVRGRAEQEGAFALIESAIAELAASDERTVVRAALALGSLGALVKAGWNGPGSQEALGGAVDLEKLDLDVAVELLSRMLDGSDVEVFAAAHGLCWLAVPFSMRRAAGGWSPPEDLLPTLLEALKRHPDMRPASHYLAWTMTQADPARSAELFRAAATLPSASESFRDMASYGMVRGEKAEGTAEALRAIETAPGREPNRDMSWVGTPPWARQPPRTS